MLAIRDALSEGYVIAAWIDPNVSIFNPIEFSLPLMEEFAFSREIWMQPDKKNGGVRGFRNVHNAVCCFSDDNPFLDF
ncbi:MAG: hypothetical protein CBB68_12460 [Rhodospirillaceae bacterium TMED8]|nr:hypothetical protein [Magnetovibrio sp.]OUT48923.1 MAG: hypothetical protein CBB68_12460 [Rhodospirillaceae bacterium TMED8]